MNQKRVFVLCVLLACFAAFLAFLFSSQPGKESVGMSRGILQWVAGLFGAELNSTSLKTWDFFFRKGAHFTLYFVLGFGLCGAFQRQKRMPPWVPALLLGAAFAATDNSTSSLPKGPPWSRMSFWIPAEWRQAAVRRAWCGG